MKLSDRFNKQSEEETKRQIQAGEICSVCELPHAQKTGFETVCMACGHHVQPDKSKAKAKPFKTIFKNKNIIN